MGESGRMMGPSEERQNVKRPSGKNSAVTMRDVATQSGFSPATVSIVLNNAPLARYIAPATKKRIEEVARKLGYRPNAMARFLRSKRTHSVGVMFFDITDPFCTMVMRGIENGLYQQSYVPIFADAHNQRNRFERYLEMLLERHVEALIVVAIDVGPTATQLGEFELAADVSIQPHFHNTHEFYYVIKGSGTMRVDDSTRVRARSTPPFGNWTRRLGSSWLPTTCWACSTTIRPGPDM